MPGIRGARAAPATRPAPRFRKSRLDESGLPLFFFSRWSGVTIASSDQLNVASVCKAKEVTCGAGQHACTPLSKVGSRRALDEAAQITVRSNADYTSDTSRVDHFRV